MPLPACEATMEQVPPVSRVAVLPETVHTLGVEDAKLTARPELAVAVSVTVPPAVCAGMALNVMVWLAGFTTMLAVTCVAAE